MRPNNIMAEAWNAWRKIPVGTYVDLEQYLTAALVAAGYPAGGSAALAYLHVAAFRHRSTESSSRTWRKGVAASEAARAEDARDLLAADLDAAHGVQS